MREKGRLPSKSWSPLNTLLSYFILIPKNPQLANSSPDPSFHIMGVYLVKSSLSRYSNDPSQSGEYLEVPSLFQIRLWNTKSARMLISSLDLKENSFPFRQKSCLPVSPFLHPLPIFLPHQAYFFLKHLVELGRMFYTFYSLYSSFLSPLIRPLQLLPSLHLILWTPLHPLPGQFLLSFFLISIYFSPLYFLHL